MSLGQILFLNTNLPTSSQLEANTYNDLNTNICNSYITYSLFKMLGIKIQDAICYNNIWHPNPKRHAIIEESARSQWIFLNLQDQLRTSFPDSDYETALETLESLDPKVRMLAFSLGANSFNGQDPALVDELSPVRRRFFEFLAMRCVSIGVRGPFTADILKRMQITNVGIVGCPSYFECGPDRVVQAPEQRVHYRSWGLTGAFRPLGFDDREHYLQGDADWPVIRLTHAPEALWQKENGKASLADSRDPLLLEAAMCGRTHFFSDFPAWKEHIQQNCRLVCGSRLHGAIVALNAGVPAIVTNGDARAQESCEFFGIPCHPEFEHQPPAKQQLIEAANPTRLNELYNERRENFLTWLRTCGLQAEPAVAPKFPSYNRMQDYIIVRRIRSMQEEALSARDGQIAELTNALSDCQERITELKANCNNLVSELHKWRTRPLRKLIMG